MCGGGRMGGRISDRILFASGSFGPPDGDLGRTVEAGGGGGGRPNGVAGGGPEGGGGRLRLCGIGASGGCLGCRATSGTKYDNAGAPY
eukprot:90592-Karenia_brevis.AAC.1